MKLTVEKLKKMIREAVIVAAIEPSQSSSEDSDTPGMFPGLSNVGLGTEEGITAIPSCDTPPEITPDNPGYVPTTSLKDVVKTVISDFVMEHSKKTRRKTK